MNREAILDEIRRTARLVPNGKLGAHTFKKLSGISEGVWRGKYWTTWTELVKKAGVAPGEKSIAHSNEELLTSLAELVRIYKRFPTQAETKIQKTKNANFPNSGAFEKLGSKESKLDKLHKFAAIENAYSDILQFLPRIENTETTVDQTADDSLSRRDGHVYMMKLGKHYKIGHTSSVPRRHREINLELPEKASVVHTIATDDPEGIETYWHHRFASKRSNGEWFLLSAEDIRSFKRRKFM